MRRLIYPGILFLTTLATPSAQAAALTFESLPDGSPVTDDFEASYGIRFSGSAGPRLATAPDYAQGNYLCSGKDYLGELFVQWTQPVSSFGFDLAGDRVSGVVAKIDLYRDGVYTMTANIIADGDPTTIDEFGIGLPVLLPGTGFTSIRLYDLANPGGIGWDNFRYNFNPADNASPLPEPSALWLMAPGLFWLARHRR